MFCKGITKKGTPCIKKIKNGKYCSSHKGDFEECVICYEDMQFKGQLSCNHSFCISCLSNCEKACPYCRQDTNIFKQKNDLAMQKISTNLRHFHFVKRKKDKIEIAHQTFKLIMKNHTKILKDKKFIQIFFEKMQELSRDGMDTEIYLNQICSYIDRAH